MTRIVGYIGNVWLYEQAELGPLAAEVSRGTPEASEDAPEARTALPEAKLCVT